MTTETWATLITTFVVPIGLRVLVHYFPWLADAVVPGAGQAVKPAGHQREQTTPETPVYPLDPEEGQ